MTRRLWLFPTPVKRINPGETARFVYVSPRRILVDAVRLSWSPDALPDKALHLDSWGLGMRELGKRDFVQFASGAVPVLVEAHHSLWFAIKNQSTQALDLQVIGLGSLVDDEQSEGSSVDA